MPLSSTDIAKSRPSHEFLCPKTTLMFFAKKKKLAKISEFTVVSCNVSYSASLREIHSLMDVSNVLVI